MKPNKILIIILIWFISTIIYSTVFAQIPFDECANYENTNPEWLFCDDFESGDFSKWDVISSPSFIKINEGSDPIFKPSISAEIQYLITDNNEEHVIQERYLEKSFVSDSNLLFSRVCLYIENEMTEGIGRELLSLSDNSPENNMPPVNIWEIELISFDFNLAINISPPQDDIFEEGDNKTFYSLYKLKAYEWNCLELEINGNSPGKRNGKVALYVNEEEVFREVDLNLKGNLKSKISKIQVGKDAERFNFLTVNEKRFFDNIIISTEYIGGIYYPGPQGIPMPCGGALKEEGGCGLITEGSPYTVTLIILLLILSLIAVARRNGSRESFWDRIGFKKINK